MVRRRSARHRRNPRSSRPASATACSNNDSRLTDSLPFAEEVVPMFRLRQCYVLILMLLVAPAAGAQDKPAAPWVVDRSLTVSPQGAPVPALKYRLLPLSAELKE